MKLLYVCGTYAAGARSGSELSAHTLLRQLTLRHAVDVAVLTDERYTGGGPGHATYDGISLAGTSYAGRSDAIRTAIRRFEPDVVLAQLNWSDEALRIARDLGVATILRVASVPVRLDLREGSRTSPTAIVTASHFVAEHIWSAWRRRAHVMPPCIDLDRVRGAGASDRHSITMFNPIDVKGGDLFRELATRLPDRRFAAVRGWSVLRGADGEWDDTLWQQSVRSQGGESYPTPREARFDDLSNVDVLPARDDVGAIYDQTRILCVPSRWDEPFGRVVIEAFANGIPVLASAVGGLPEHAGLAGTLLSRDASVADWAAAVEALDDERRYATLSQRARDAADSRFGFDASVEPFIQLLQSLGQT